MQPPLGIKELSKRLIFHLQKALGENIAGSEKYSASMKLRMARIRASELKTFDLNTLPTGDSSKKLLHYRNSPHRIALTFLLLFLSGKKVKKISKTKTFH
jgi:hypothetical protein